MERLINPENLESQKPSEGQIFETNLESANQEKSLLETEEAEQREQNYQIMQQLLATFGTEKARQNFLDLCREYHNKLREQKLSSVKGYSEKEKGRDSCHNEIMRTLQKLSLAQKPGTEAEHFLFELSDREKISQIINDYLKVSTSFKHPRLTKTGRWRLGEFGRGERPQSY